jgi:hypothetical protein
MERPLRRSRHGHAYLAGFFEVRVPEPFLRARVGACGVEQEVQPGLGIVINLRRPEPCVSPLVGIIGRERAARYLLPSHQVSRLVDREVVAWVGAVGGISVVVAGLLVVQDVRVGRGERRVVVVRGIRADPGLNRTARCGQWRHPHRQRRGNHEEKNLAHGTPCRRERGLVTV